MYNVACRLVVLNISVMPFSNISFKGGRFVSNSGQILYLEDISKNLKSKISMIGPIIIGHDWATSSSRYDLLLFINMIVDIHGPVIVSYNNAQGHAILELVSSEIYFNDNIIFKFNTCRQVFSIYIYVKVMEYTNITFVDNKCSKKLIEVNNIDSKDDYCLFQYMTFNSRSVLPNNYIINVKNTLPAQQNKY